MTTCFDSQSAVCGLQSAVCGLHLSRDRQGSIFRQLFSEFGAKIMTICKRIQQGLSGGDIYLITYPTQAKQFHAAIYQQSAKYHPPQIQTHSSSKQSSHLLGLYTPNTHSPTCLCIDLVEFTWCIEYYFSLTRHKQGLVPPLVPNHQLVSPGLGAACYP